MKVLIVGAGKLGYRLAQQMLLSDIEVTIMDTNSKILDRVNNQLDVLTINANGVQIDVLKNLNIGLYDLTIAVTSNDETNIVISSITKKLGCKKTIARIRNPEYVEAIPFIKKEMNIDHIVNPELAIATEISRYILKKYAFYSSDFVKGKVSMIDLNVNNIPGFIGKKIHELEDLDDLLITAISKNGNLIIPHGGSILEKDDILYLIGTRAGIKRIADKSQVVKNKSKNKKHIEKVFILGGGKIGYYLAKKLLKEGIRVKIVEQSTERCKYLSEKLDKALIICGDGSDINILEEEEIDTMDAFVGVTGFDEENLLMSLLAKKSGVKEVISKVSRSNYVGIIEKLGVDVALNPINITVSNILKFIRGGKVISVSLLLGNQAEVLEMVASEDLSIIGKPIEKIGLPKGIIIGAIGHNGKAIIPDGKSIIHPNDRLVIFCLSSEIHALDPFFKGNKGGLLNELSNFNKGIRNFINN
jgi:trk system potassium uptake protein TrkA